MCLTRVEPSWREGVKLKPWTNGTGVFWGHYRSRQKLSALKNTLFLPPRLCLATLEKRNQNKSCLGKPQRCNKIGFAHPGLRSAVTRGCEESPGDGARVGDPPVPSSLSRRAGWAGDLAEVLSSSLRLGSPRTCGV